MTRTKWIVLERHFAARQKRDVEGVLAIYTEDVEHDAVGRDPNPAAWQASGRALGTAGRSGSGSFASSNSEMLIARESAWFDIIAVQRQLAPPRHG